VKVGSDILCRRRPEALGNPFDQGCFAGAEIAAQAGATKRRQFHGERPPEAIVSSAE